MNEFVGELASETYDWMLRAPRGEREDVTTEVLAFSLATFVDGRALTRNGYEDTATLEGRE